MSDKKYITQKEAANLMDCSQKTVLRWVTKGLLPLEKKGRQYKILRDRFLARLDAYQAQIVANKLLTAKKENK
jgi:excisionase family DNA binding protein